MHAMDSIQAMGLRAVIRRPRLVTARVGRGFMVSPVSVPVTPDLGTWCADHARRETELEWLDRGVLLLSAVI
jgi:hypothetical protein